jgi:hypothetical protein
MRSSIGREFGVRSVRRVAQRKADLVVGRDGLVLERGGARSGCGAGAVPRMFSCTRDVRDVRGGAVRGNSGHAV